jgi:Uma2 family endonuclease
LRRDAPLIVKGERAMTTPTVTVAPGGQPAPPERLITAEEFAAMSELGRAELIDGRIIKMPPPKSRHGRLENKIAFLLTRLVLELKLGLVLTGESGVYIRRNPDTVRGMDVAFISNERWSQQSDKDDYLEIAPDLVVEVLSPDDRWPAVNRKLRDYFSIGVRLVWVVDPDERIVYAYRSAADMREFAENSTLTGDEVLPGFSAPVASLFEE